MQIRITWAGHKRDDNGKDHLWGFLHKTEDRVTSNFIFYSECNSANVHLNQISTIYGYNSARRKKIDLGYRLITQERIDAKFPSILVDIEMQFMIRKLQK